MSTSIISMPFDFDGETLSKGSIKLSVDRCDVEGINFYLPPQYGLLLLREETKVEAQKLLNELTTISITDTTRKDMVKQACGKGFKFVWLQLQQYKQHLPNSEPKFYAELNHNRQIETSRIVLVTTERAMRFYASEDLNPTISQLPLNVYNSPIEYTRFELTLDRYRWLSGREKEFLDFVQELNHYIDYIRGDTCEVCYNKFFEDTSQAYHLLKEIRDKASSRASRDQLFQTLESKCFLAFSEGLFVHSDWSTYFISKNGEVHRLCYSKKVDMREAVLRAYEKGKLPTKLEDVKENFTLRHIAEIVGKVRPDLALVILP